MRRLILVALCLSAVPLACKTPPPPQAENPMPIGGPDEVRETGQTVPDDPPGPATPVPSVPDAGTDAGSEE